MDTPSNPEIAPSAPQPKRPYIEPRLVCHGSLEAITKSTSSGTIADGGTQPNKTLTMMV
jgi:hypothetical protein